MFISDVDDKGQPLLTMAGVFDVWKSKPDTAMCFV